MVGITFISFSGKLDGSSGMVERLLQVHFAQLNKSWNRKYFTRKVKSKHRKA